MTAISEKPRPPIQVETRSVEPELKSEPFLTWDILQEARLPQLWNIPAKDIQVAKTAIVLDSFPNLNLQQKRRLLAFRLWYLDGSYGRIKKYIGEDKAPSWEALSGSSTRDNHLHWDSLVNSVWDTPDLENRFEEVQEIMAVMNNLTRNGADIVRFMVIFKKFKELEDQGLEYDEILDRRKQIATDRSRERTRTYRYLELRKDGKTDEEITADLQLSTEAVKTIQDGLLYYGFITPFRNPEKERVEGNKKADMFSLLQKRILEMKKKKMSKEQIIRETGEEPGTVELNISILIFIGALSPQPSTARRSEEFKAFCLEVERVYVEHPDWDYEQVAKELTTTKPQVKKARMILMGAKRLQPIIGAKERHRTEENIENEQAIYSLRRTEPDLSQTQIAKRLGLSLWIVQHYIARGVNKEFIPRKRPLPNKTKS